MLRLPFARAVVAFGGNALSPRGNEAESFQSQLAEDALGRVLDALGVDASLVFVHGNGPQVGAALLRDQAAADIVQPMSMAAHVAETQGSMGFQLELALRNGLVRRRAERAIATLTTLVTINSEDPTLHDPRKPVGPYYAREEVTYLQQDHGWIMAEDSGRGWRRLVASPPPVRVLNGALIQSLMESGALVIAGGGGGVPLLRDGDRGRWRSFDAVIDKDRTAMLVGESVGADLWVCLTGVDQVYTDFGTKQQRPLAQLDTEGARRLLKAGQFPAGSMGPKVESAVGFVERTGGRALITSPNHLSRAMARHSGTLISD